MQHRVWLSWVALLGLLGCQAIHPIAPSVGPNAPISAQQADPTLRGRVDFSGVRHAQSSSADVTNSATISFIDTGSNATVATGQTDSSGNFSLNLGAFAPVNGGTYILEAIKGLNNQAPGSDAARFRTIVQWNGTGWLSCTNAAINGSLLINSLTTALAIESSLDSAIVTPASTLGKVNVSVTPPALNIPAPYANHPNAEITQLAVDLISYLGSDADPVASVPAILPRITSFSPTNGAPGSLISLQGVGFSPVPTGNTVAVNGVVAQVLLATTTSLVVIVPNGATTGAVVVQTGRGTVTGANFTVTAAPGAVSLSGFSPTGGRSGAAVTLTGQFGSGTATPSVSFACAGGRVQAAVSAWSASSMTVTVPVGVVPGPIQVQSGMVTATSGIFDGWPGDVSRMINISPPSTTSINPYTTPVAIYAQAGATWGSPPQYHYMVGGNYGTPNQDLADAWMISVKSDGSLGNWTHQSSLNYTRRHTTAAIYGNYLYVVGGYNVAALGTLATIERATINPADGSLGPFTIAATMQVPRYDMGVAISGTTLYILGGESAGARNDYESYSIAANGNLTYLTSGTMTAGGVAITNRAFGLKVLGNYLVMAGGYINETYSSHAVVVFPIGGGGTLGAGVYGPDLDQPYYECDFAAIGNDVYLLGGSTGAAYQSSVAHATFDPNAGTLSAWLYDSPPMPRPVLYSREILEVGNRIYTFAGLDNGGAISCIHSTTVDPNSGTRALARWSVYGSIPLRLHGFMGTVIGNKAWVIGGINYEVLGDQTVETNYYVIHDDGSIGPATPGPNLNAKNYWAQTAVGNGYLYILGGLRNGAWCDVIERAPVNPDGTLGSFSVLTNRLPTAFGESSAAVIGKYLYVASGTNGSGLTASVFRATMNLDGSLSPFENCKITIPAGVSEDGGLAVAGNNLYLYRAWNGSILADVLVAPIYPDGLIGTFTSAPSLAAANYAGAFGLIGNYLYCFGGWAGAAPATSIVQRMPLGAGGVSAGAWTLDQPGGNDIMPMPSSHWTNPPYVYGNWVVLFSGYNGLPSPYNNDRILVGSIH